MRLSPHAANGHFNDVMLFVALGHQIGPMRRLACTREREGQDRLFFDLEALRRILAGELLDGLIVRFACIHWGNSAWLGRSPTMQT